MDRIHGTDDAFRRSKNYERNIILFGFTSARELFPDPQKRKSTNGECRAEGGGRATASEVSYSS